MSAIASTELVRQQNSLRLLAALRRHGSLSHTDMTAVTGLASATVSAITAELERAQIIGRSEQQPGSGRGRPRVMFNPRGAVGYLAIVVISSDAVQYSLVNFAGNLLDRFTEARATSALDRFADSVGDGIARLADRSRIDAHDILHIAVSSKGLVDAQEATLVWSPVLGARQVRFGEVLGQRFTASVSLYNETMLVAGALLAREGEGDQGNPPALAALSLGHSIGLGVARRSSSGAPDVIAPNFGHMLHVPGGALCRCGSKGCIEAYCGFYGILRTAFEVPITTIPAAFVPLVEVEKIAMTARAGNRTAALAFRQAGLALGNGLSRLFSLHGVMPVVVTGPGTRFYDLLAPGIVEGMSQASVVRLSGLPQITIELDEPALVFAGHMGLALSRLDEDIVTTGIATIAARAASSG